MALTSTQKRVRLVIHNIFIMIGVVICIVSPISMAPILVYLIPNGSDIWIYALVGVLLGAVFPFIAVLLIVINAMFLQFEGRTKKVLAEHRAQRQNAKEKAEKREKEKSEKAAAAAAASSAQRELEEVRAAEGGSSGGAMEQPSPADKRKSARMSRRMEPTPTEADSSSRKSGRFDPDRVNPVDVDPYSRVQREQIFGGETATGGGDGEEPTVELDDIDPYARIQREEAEAQLQEQQEQQLGDDAV